MIIIISSSWLAFSSRVISRNFVAAFTLKVCDLNPKKETSIFAFLLGIDKRNSPLLLLTVPLLGFFTVIFTNVSGFLSASTIRPLIVNCALTAELTRKKTRRNIKFWV